MDFVLRNLGEVSDGYIFDCGANIGTTTIYLSKATEDKLRVIAFEPVMTNYRLLKANCAFNSVENVTLENKALNFENTTGEMLIWEANYGACAVKGIRDDSKYYQMEPKTQNVNFVKLDDYCVNNNISAEEIRLFWIDTEGFEANVIKGALTILSESDALTYMEFNYETYLKNNQLNEICDNLEKIYKKFIVYEEQQNGVKRFRDISELRKVKENCNILYSK